MDQEKFFIELSNKFKEMLRTRKVFYEPKMVVPCLRNVFREHLGF